MESYEKLRDRVFEDLSNLRRKYSGEDLEAQKVSYLQRMIEGYSDTYIQDEEGNNRTHDFLKGLYDIIMDPANRELLYRFENSPLSEVDRPAFRYKNIPSVTLHNCIGFKVIYIPAEVEVARCILSYMNGVASVKYLEVADDFKSQLRPSQFMPDCILGEFGYRTRIEYDPNFMGKENVVEDVVSKTRAF